MFRLVFEIHHISLPEETQDSVYLSVFQRCYPGNLAEHSDKMTDVRVSALPGNLLHFQMGIHDQKFPCVVDPAGCQVFIDRAAKETFE